MSWKDTDGNECEIILSNPPTYNITTRILSTLTGTIGGFIKAINTTNTTPLKYFVAVYKYETTLSGHSKTGDSEPESQTIPILEITDDERVFITIPNDPKEEILDFTYTGSMYLLKSKAHWLLGTQFVFMLGVRETGLCCYGIRTGLFEAAIDGSHNAIDKKDQWEPKINVFFANAIKPPIAKNSVWYNTYSI